MHSISAATLVVLFGILGSALAICPGFNYGIGNQQKLGDSVSRWTVYGDACHEVESLTTTENPCTQSIFSCSPAPIHFTSYKNSFNGLRYACRTDPNSGRCGGD